MRRLMYMMVAVLLCVNMLAPIAGASLVTPHSCCVRNPRHDAPTVAAPHDHCGHAAQGAPASPSSSSLSSSPQAPCHGCCSCLGPVVSSRPQARPGASFLIFTPQDSHPFLHEFYPAADSSSEFRQNPDRAPPSSESIQ
jgi:hypothetical protein